jgi:hypothetical protein
MPLDGGMDRQERAQQPKLRALVQVPVIPAVWSVRLTYKCCRIAKPNSQRIKGRGQDQRGSVLSCLDSLPYGDSVLHIKGY